VTSTEDDAMTTTGSVVIIGGTAGIGQEIARHYARRGRAVVVSGRDPDRAAAEAARIGDGVRCVGLDLTRPETIADSLSSVEDVAYLVLAAIERDHNTVQAYDLVSALRLVTLKIVGYTEVVHALAPRFTTDAAIVLFGGMAKDRPYAGSTTVSSVNGAVTGMVRTLAVELAPVRVNAVHPGIVGDSPYWTGKEAALDAVRARTPTGRLVAMRDVVDAVVLLLENRSLNGVDLPVDGGWMLL
jgi:NAD(P)-dependent dehydrogenase (short-subunit alcohol dehydrogenase family)